MKFILLQESLQQARKILKEKNIEEDNADYQYLRKMMGNNLGFLGFFTDLLINKKVSLEELYKLYNTINTEKYLLNRLPQKIEKYTKLEELEDDIQIAREWHVYGKEFCNRLTSAFRNKSKKDSQLKDSYYGLNDNQKRDLIENFIPKMAKYTDYNQFKEDVLSYIDADADIEDTIYNIESTDGAQIIYNENNIIIAIISDFKASCKLGSKSWCISTGITSWNMYTGVDNVGLKKQFFLWNYNIPQSSIESKIGITINSSGSISNTHLKNDYNFNHSISKYMQEYKIPSYILSKYKFNFKEEHQLLSKYVKPNVTLFIKLLKENPDIIPIYRDRLSINSKNKLDILEDSDLSKFSELEVSIFKKEDISHITEYLIKSLKNYTENIELYIEEQSESVEYKKIENLSFYFKMKLVHLYDLEEYYKFIFINDIKSDEYKLDFDQDDIKLKIQFDEESDYLEKVYGLDDWGVNYYAMSSEYYVDFSSDIESEVYYLLDSALSDSNKKLIKKYLESITQYIVHPDLKKYITGAASTIFESSDFHDEYKSFSKTMIKHINAKFSDDIGYDSESIFKEIVDTFIENAENAYKEDIRYIQGFLIGEFIILNDEWVIELDDMIGVLEDGDGDGDNDPLFIKELSSIFSNTLIDINTDSSVINGDSIEGGGNIMNYYGDYDFSSENEDFAEKIEELTSIDYIETHEQEQITQSKLLNNNFIPVSFDNNYNYNYNVNYGYLKESSGEYSEYIPLESIDFDKVDIYTFPKVELTYDKVKKILEDKMDGVTSRKSVSIATSYESGETNDPNQLSLFERVMNFENFSMNYSKLKG